ncbi:hypothetical protein Lesp02_76950 [Lentzea sp. NBRC 105346]|uniref:MarR family winged helix-turn-helix transcriptional regulator n=1 Tax=Lentzea sp. NBRC 105346 TaxID=3032205 RepID=UPI0024A007D6|nr:MarR family transcriptional regulator [Lentzea sp. NBRC 105346]GLZ35508.1 hypothetical protein Lesp02_76950 [Lentzea sp. NBRC 105346]
MTHPSLAQKLTDLFEVVRPSPEREYRNTEVADALAAMGIKVTPTQIANLRSGKQDNPSARLRDGLARFFNVPLEYLADPVEEPERPIENAIGWQNARQLAVAVQRMLSSIGNDLDGLPQSAVDCLTNLAGAPDGTLSITELAKLSDVTTATASRIVTQLVERGLVVRVLPREDDKDRRFRRVRITDETRDLVGHYYELQPEHQLKLFGQFSAEELEIAARVFGVVTEIAHDRADAIQSDREQPRATNRDAG